jgi:RNA recognition motif. (a.k.a. RRM, RBD, or RNP domain)
VDSLFAYIAEITAVKDVEMAFDDDERDDDRDFKHAGKDDMRDDRRDDREYRSRDRDSFDRRDRDRRRDTRRSDNDDGFYSKNFKGERNGGRREYQPRDSRRGDRDGRDNRDRDTRSNFQRHFGRPLPTSTTLIVENIPPQNCTADSISDFFSRFGAITNIKLEPHVSKCTITFASHREAQSCYNSPDVIFDNRFVKVYWLREEAPEKTEPTPSEIEAKKREAELARIKRAEKNAAIHQGRAVLVDKQLEEQKRLMSMLEDATVSNEEKRQIMTQLKMLGESTQSMMMSVPSKPTFIGTKTVEPAPVPVIDESQPQPVLSGPGVRGRGTFRGRGGRGGGVGRFKLDLRPTKFILTVPSSFKEMQSHYQVFYTYKANAWVCGTREQTRRRYRAFR